MISLDWKVSLPYATDRLPRIFIARPFALIQHFPPKHEANGLHESYSVDAEPLRNVILKT